MIIEYALLIPVALLLGVTLWNVLAWPKVAVAAEPTPGSVSVLIPARNEEGNLAACLDRALQPDAAVGEVLIYDDHSTDGTAGIIADYARRDVRVRGIAALPLPAGWCGKNYACDQLARAASGEWLLFLDADARLAESAAARLLAEAQRRRATFISAWPGLTMIGFWEKTLLPLLNFVVFTLFPAPLSLARDDVSLGLAHGACILVERESYFAVGGHAAAPDEIFEDRRLAQRWRARGKRGLCLDGQDVVSVRMYASLGEIWRGFQKNFFPAFRREPGFWAFLLLHGAVFLLPFVLIVTIRSWPLAASAAGVLAMRALLAARFRHPWWSVILHPVGEAMLIAIGLSSWQRCKSGRGVEWKGRRYHASGH